MDDGAFSLADRVQGWRIWHLRRDGGIYCKLFKVSLILRLGILAYWWMCV